MQDWKQLPSAKQFYFTSSLTNKPFTALNIFPLSRAAFPLLYKQQHKAPAALPTSKSDVYVRPWSARDETIIQHFLPAIRRSENISWLWHVFNTKFRAESLRSVEFLLGCQGLAMVYFFDCIVSEQVLAARVYYDNHPCRGLQAAPMCSDPFVRAVTLLSGGRPPARISAFMWPYWQCYTFSDYGKRNL